ncbi:hypothetical protein D0A38_14790 [Xanthomonas campestris pv. incanae]|nr:hypothetical protein D0A38_14790 [Xanthomonas campestris pv. incanae]
MRRLGLCAVDLDAIWGHPGIRPRRSALARDEAFRVTPIARKRAPTSAVVSGEVGSDQKKRMCRLGLGSTSSMQPGRAAASQAT